MTLYLIGLGLYDEKDITLRGLELVKKCDFVYLEHYTSILSASLETLEKFYHEKIIVADRDLVESRANEIITKAKKKNVAFLVVGDVFSATTHTDLMIRAKNADIKVEVINNTSVMNAVGVTGLELYKFGKTTSITFPEEGFKPTTAYDVIRSNIKTGLHTLCLLDIKVAEPSKEDMIKGKKTALPPRFMTINEGIKQLLEMEKEKKIGVFTENTLIVGCARLCAPDQKIVYGTAKELLKTDFGGPLHCLIVTGNLHFMEEEALMMYKTD
jgi:diphthine methyl ester synthase